MTKKLEINFTKKPEMVFQFDQFLNVEQAVDKFLNKKENLERLIAPLIPTNLEETIQKLIPEVEDGKTPIKGIDYNDGKDGETPDEETLLELIKTQIPEPIPGNDGKTPEKGVDYFTKKELEDIKKGLKEAIMSEMTNHITKEEVNIRLEEIKKQVNSLPQSGGAQFLRQLMDVNVGVPTAQQYGLTYNPSRSEFSLTAITGGGGAVDSVNGQTGVVVLDADDIDDTSTTNKFVTASDITKLGNLSGTNTGDVTVSDSSEIDFTLTGQQISASIVAGSIDETKLDTSVNASLDLADTAVQPAGLSGYELLSNKSTSTSLGTSDTLYPTQNAVKTYVDSSVVGLLDDRGNYDASGNVFPSSGGSGTAGAVLKGDIWYISVGGTLGGTVVYAGYSVRALADTPGQTASNWSISNVGLGYIPENVANKVTSLSGASTDTEYPSAKLTYDQLDLKVTANAGITGATKTKITYDAKGLVTSGADATTADIADSTNKRYVTDADLTDIGNLSGTNTGDQTITNSSDATSHTVTLSASGGSVQLIEGTNITLTTGGTASAGTVTIAATGSSGATTALDNLASVAINTSLVSDTDNTDDLGTTLKKWANLFVTTIGATATRVTKGWFTDLEVTNAIAGSITGNAATVTTNANLTGDVTSTGNATTIANSSVTLAKMANLAQDQFIGRTTASTGVPETATITAAARTVLDDTTVAAMVDTLGGATSTGTGGLVRATSPTLVTPALGTPSALVATNATGTATGLTSGITNALKSATTTVDVSAATAPTSGQVLTATSGTAATWQTPSGGMFKSLLSTCFEDTGRFIQDATSGTGTFGVEGCLLDTTATTTRSYRLRARNYSTSRFLTFAGSPQWTASINVPTFAGTGSFYIGMGAITCDGTGHTFTDAHIGFKILVVAGVASLYATQADGTENASSALTTLATSDNLELYIKVNSTTSVDYYWRKNGGALSSATNLTSNLPTSNDNTWFQGSCSNNSTANQQQLQLQGASYSR